MPKQFPTGTMPIQNVQSVEKIQGQRRAARFAFARVAAPNIFQELIPQSSCCCATDKIESLRRFRDDVREVATNFECGIGLAGFHDLEVGDIIECFTQQTASRNTGS